MINSKLKSTSHGDAAKRYFLWKSLLLFLCAVIPAATAQAQQKFRLTVSDSIPVSSEGFQFFHVEIATTRGLPAAKNMTIWCHVESQSNRRNRIRMIQPIAVTLPAGDVMAEKDLYLPSQGAVSFSLDAAGGSNRNSLIETPSDALNDQCQDVLIVDGLGVGDSSVTFDRNKVLTKVLSSPTSSQSFFGQMSNGGNVLFHKGHSKVAYLPKRWIGYSSVEQVIIDKDDFAALHQDVERFEALVQWVTMGGSLIVSDFGDDFQGITSVMRYFRRGESGAAAKMTLYRPSEVLEAKRKILIRRVRVPIGITDARDLGVLNLGGLGVSSGVARLPKDGFSTNWKEVTLAAGKGGGLKLDTETGALLHRFGLGRILFRSAPVKDSSGTQWLGDCYLCVTAQQEFSSVLGAQNAAGKSYKKWQLLNVGIAPIGLFVFVVIAFMVLIGPLGYSYLKVKKKLHYQIWMVPLISALACTALLGYAILSEGVGTKLRPTVFVELDQYRKVAATFARYSVYSALQPRPYQFRDDQLATLENAGDQTPSVYRWQDHQYQVSGGYASARNVHQVFVAGPVKTDSGIGIKRSNNAQSLNSLAITNRFKDDVKLLVVKAKGELYFAQNLAQSETQLTPPATDDEFAKSLDVKKMFNQLIPSNAQDYRFSRRRMFYNQGSNQNRQEWDVGVKRVVSFSSVAGIRQNLTDGHYIAILDSMTEVPSVVTGAREIDGRVVVHGKW